MANENFEVSDLFRIRPILDRIGLSLEEIEIMVKREWLTYRIDLINSENYAGMRGKSYEDKLKLIFSRARIHASSKEIRLIAEAIPMSHCDMGGTFGDPVAMAYIRNAEVRSDVIRRRRGMKMVYQNPPTEVDIPGRMVLREILES